MWSWGQILAAVACWVLPPITAAAAFLLIIPGNPLKQARSVADRIAWSGFALGVYLMWGLLLLDVASGGVREASPTRSFEIIRQHGQFLVCLTLSPFLAPVLVFALQVRRRWLDSTETHPSIKELK